MMTAVELSEFPHFPFDAPSTAIDDVVRADSEQALVASLQTAKATRRAAFDIGSGTTKLLVADVDVANSRCDNVLLTREVPVLYGVDSKRSADGCLSEEVQQQGLAVLRSLLKEAHDLQVESVVAVATEVFRRAPNGAAFSARVQHELGLWMCVVDQAIEALLGFRTAMALASVPHDKLVMWDCGGGSFQLVAASPCGCPGKLDMHLGALGDSVATAMLLQIQGKSPANAPSPNPVSLHDAELLIKTLKGRMSEPPEWLIGSPNIVAIGGRNSMFFLLADMMRDGLVEGEVGLDMDDAPAFCTVAASAPRSALEVVAECSEAELARRWCWRANSDPPSMVLPKLCLIGAFVERLGLSEFQWRRTTGSCAGIAISDLGVVGSAN